MSSPDDRQQQHQSNGDIEHGHHNGGDQNGPTSTRSRFSVIVEDFSFIWFTISMNTGILSILMHTNPYQFHGLGVLSTIMFVFNLVLFIAFFCILVLRILWFPRKLWSVITTNLNECCMMGAVPIAFATIVGQVALTVSTAHWGGHAFMLVAYVLWWINAFVMVSTALFVFILVGKFNITSSGQMTPVMVLPFVGTATLAVVGGVVVNYSYGMNSRLAVPVIVVAYMLVGIGFLVAIIVFSAYFVRLMDSGFPPPAQSPGLFLLVGPPGQSAAALLLLGTAAREYFPGYMKGTTLTAVGGDIFAESGVLLAFMFVGLAIFFEIVCVYMILEAAFQKRHQYSLMWWSVIFPNATVNTAWVSFAEDLDSPAFRVLATAFLLILLVAFFVNWGFTIYAVATGRLLNGKRSDAPFTERTKEQ